MFKKTSDLKEPRTMEAYKANEGRVGSGKEVVIRQQEQLRRTINLAFL